MFSHFAFIVPCSTTTVFVLSVLFKSYFGVGLTIYLLFGLSVILLIFLEILPIVPLLSMHPVESVLCFTFDVGISFICFMNDRVTPRV